jgi:transcriptional regulator with XRE-family HTH domain
MTKPERPKVEPIYRKLGKLIAEQRSEQGMTQEVLAKKAHMSRPALANIEKGRQRIMIHQVLRIEKVLGHAAADLIQHVC